jgi:hypothetical protein
MRKDDLPIARSFAMSDAANQISLLTADLSGFHSFIGEKLKEKNVGISPEEALDIWRAQHPLPDDFEENVEALREALEDMEAGDVGIPVEQFFREFREDHGLPPRP